MKDQFVFQSQEECTAWLLRWLSGGKVLCDIIREDGRKNGFTRGQISAARKALSVKTYHQLDEGGAIENWFWSLP